MSNDDKVGCWAAVVLAASSLAMFIGGFTVGQLKIRQEAIEAGVAEWQVDPKTGSTRFVFKEQP